MIYNSGAFIRIRRAIACFTATGAYAQTAETDDCY